MIRQLPIIPTILVVAAAAIMVWLGFWQLGRAEEKAQMIAEFEAAQSNNEVVDISSEAMSALVYRQVRVDCPNPFGQQAVAGRNEYGQSGYAHRVQCTDLPSDEFHGNTVSQVFADIGWSRAPQASEFSGGVVSGTLVALGDDFKVVSGEPLAGLQRLAKPDPNDLPNNHLAYAGQWFFFALTALVIYWFAVRSRLARKD